MEYKECRCAKHEGDRFLPITMFGKNKNYADGYHGTCKICTKIEQKRAYEADPEKSRRQAMDSYTKHKQQRAEYLKAKHEQRRTDVDYIAYCMWYAAKARAKKNHLEFSILVADIVIPEVCPVFGIKITRSRGVATDASPTLDRIDSSKGYTKDNIHVICKRANTIKNSGTPDEHRRIYEYFSQTEDSK